MQSYANYAKNYASGLKCTPKYLGTCFGWFIQVFCGNSNALRMLTDFSLLNLHNMHKKFKAISTTFAVFHAARRSFFVFGLIFFPLWAQSQTDCAESAMPKFDPDQEQRTLCQKYSPPLKFPNRFGTATTQLASHIISNLNNGNDVFTGDIDLVGDLTIDQDFTLLNCKIRISPNVKITVLAGVTFTLDGSKLFCCQNLWNGIDLIDNSTMVTKNTTEIEDATTAIESLCAANLSIANTTFNRNSIGIHIGSSIPTQVPCGTISTFTQFSGNLFQCNAPLNGTIDGVSLAGILVKQAVSTIGALTSTMNEFRNLQVGIFYDVEGGATSAVNRCRFRGVLTDGILMKEGSLVVDDCLFYNNGSRGINLEKTRGLVVRRSSFVCDDDAPPQSGPIHSYQHVLAAGFQLAAKVDIHHNYFGGNFLNTEKRERLNCIQMAGSSTMGAGTSITIDFNDFNLYDVEPGGANDNSGIALTGEFPSSSRTLIEANEFYLDHPLPINIDGVNGTEIVGIKCTGGNKNNVSIFSNMFDSNAWGSFSKEGNERGMLLVGSIGEGNQISGNTFTYSPNTLRSNEFISGIWSIDFANTTYCGNDIKECGAPMSFSGISMGTVFKGNTITGGGTGLRISDGFIGEQGSQGGTHNGNKWYDKWSNVRPSFHAVHFPAPQAVNSRIFAHMPQSEYDTVPGFTFFSEFHPVRIEPDSMDEWFKEDPTGFPSAVSCLDQIVVVSETDRAIAAGTISLTGLSPAHGWTAKRYLYAKLMHHPETQDDYGEFGPFLSNEVQASVGQLFAVEQKISEGLVLSANLVAQLGQIQANQNLKLQEVLLADSILGASTDASALAAAQNSKKLGLGELQTLVGLYDSLNDTYRTNLVSKLQEALVFNGNVNAAQDYEQYEKTVNDIAIRQVLSQNGVLTAAQVVTLASIADACPKYGGHGVYRARGMLMDCHTRTWNDEQADCYPARPLVQEQVLEHRSGPRLDNQQITSQAFAYPNPATDGVYIRTIPNQQGQIALQDMTGKIWRTAEFGQADETKYLDLSNVPAGVYACILKVSTGERQVIKIFVNKP